ncbi:tyrosine-type recombinase/integrase [Deltaproteobacteria bacterium IMCC39524]|nr:tyrosine-type recombinase/integrase [Deltaproteobacteria bacterium IMCC39524]
MSSKRFPFTKRAIEAISPHDPDSKSREAEYSDAECIGLKLRVSKGGRKFFQHRYRYMGRKKCLTIGEFPHVTIQDARQRVSEHKSLLSRQIDPSDERSQKTNDLTFSVFVADFYIPHAKQHKKTWQEDVYKLEGQIIPAFGKYRLSSITARDISTFLTQQKERTSSTTANHYATLLKRMFNLAVKWGLLEKSPATGLDRFKEKPHRERYLTKEELPRFLKALDDLEDGLSKAAIKLLLFTGGRRGEITSLRYDQLKLNEKRLFLPDTKNGKSRSIILNDRAIAVIKELKKNKSNSPRTEESEYLFPTKQGTKRPYIYDLRTPFGKACDAAGISGLRVHDLRHSFATLALQGGASLYDVSKLLGHSDVSMTQRYAHMADDSLQTATDNMAGVIDRVVDG